VLPDALTLEVENSSLYGGHSPLSGYSIVMTNDRNWGAKRSFAALKRRAAASRQVPSGVAEPRDLRTIGEPRTNGNLASTLNPAISGDLAGLAEQMQDARPRKTLGFPRVL